MCIARPGEGETLADLSEADTPGGRDHVPDLDIAGAGELAEGQLHEVERTTYHDEDHQVGDEEGPATVLVGCEGKPPDIAQTHRHGYAGHQELRGVGPLLSLSGQASNLLASFRFFFGFITFRFFEKM